ncbi:hypothetical protein B0H14DRAFT_3018251 [Mycena olivaceomarginata]|nr:hypothetical protein B0H14DRAFT_3018251 [Mycena olivaceomarginata]
MNHTYTAAAPTVFVGLSCSACCRIAENLLRCARCRRVWYCNAEHKSFCKAIHSVDSQKDPVSYFPPETPNDREKLDIICVSHKCRMIDLYQESTRTPLNKHELYLLSCEPRCLGWCCSPTVGKLTRCCASKCRPVESTPKRLSPCPQCMMVFFCSDEHWETALSVHNSSWNKLPGSLSECEVSRHLRIDAEFRATMSSPQLAMWRFMRRQRTWTPLINLTWDTIFGDDIHTALAGDTDENIAACLRMMSSLASTAMTALYALEQLYNHVNWNIRSSLTIHVLGSNAEFDHAVVCMYETIMHRIPNLINLHIVFCDIKLGVSRHASRDVTLCQDCQQRSASLVHEYIGNMFAVETFQMPDLCILMNGYIANNETALWSQTIDILLQQHIPSLFTANEYGVCLVPCLTLAENPWGSLSMQLNLDSFTAFVRRISGWVGAFMEWK